MSSNNDNIVSDLPQSERLRCGVWNEANKHFAHLLYTEVDVTKYIGGPFSEAQIEQRIAREMDGWRSHGVQYFPLFLKSNGDFIGCCGLRIYDTTNHIFELGFHLRSAYWGCGYAKEAALMVIKYAFEVKQINTLFAGHNPNNVASKKLLEGLGFVYQRQEFYPGTGLMHPSYLLWKHE